MAMNLILVPDEERNHEYQLHGLTLQSILAIMSCAEHCREEIDEAALLAEAMRAAAMPPDEDDKEES